MASSLLIFRIIPFSFALRVGDNQVTDVAYIVAACSCSVQKTRTARCIRPTERRNRVGTETILPLPTNRLFGERTIEFSSCCSCTLQLRPSAIRNCVDTVTLGSRRCRWPRRRALSPCTCSSPRSRSTCSTTADVRGARRQWSTTSSLCSPTSKPGGWGSRSSVRGCACCSVRLC